MTKDEALAQALEALENMSTALGEDDVLGSDIELMLNAITAIKEALAQPEQEPAAWRHPKFDIVSLWPWSLNLVPLYTSPPQRESVGLTDEERNFCPRCGKRTADLATIHTCTPPQEKNV